MKVSAVIVILGLVGAASALPFGRPNYQNMTAPNPDEMGDNFEGDIKFAADQVISPHTGILDPYWRWEKIGNNPTIPYVFDSAFTATHRAVIVAGMATIQASTCVRFVPRTSERDYITIQSANSGCWSYVGRIRNAQILNLSIQAGCVTKGIATHELIHAVGFFHAQSDVNRDQYVRIKWENVMEGKEHNFEVYTNSYVTDYGEGYDYGSIMHYGPYAFSKNYMPTIEAIYNTGEIMGQRDTATHRAVIVSGMATIQASTCVRFVPRTTERDYITIQSANSGCWSYVGRIRNAQILNLSIQAGCVTKGIATHELIHAVGFFHAQSDVNRDQYVRIKWENVMEGKEHNFEVYTNSYF
uniref:Metalloendopeptidase n=1 Tax=Lutzomyia longipalpis TaxID=7200 RepID=A0A1B0CS03_LUTLO